MLETGDAAPKFSLQANDGSTVKLAGFKVGGCSCTSIRRPTRPGCTQQTCALRDIADQVGDTAIVGISPDSVARQDKFATKYSVPFPLLADEDHAVAEAFGVWTEKNMYGRKYMGILRSAFLIGPTGKVEHAWYKISPKDTPKKLLEALAAA